MASLNKVMLIGNAGRDAELRYTASGTPQSQFSLAVNRRVRNQQTNDWEDQTEWFNIVIFGDQAERVSQYITKGKQIYAEGRLQTRNWDDDQGVKHTRVEVIANNIVLLGGRDGGQGGGGDWGDAGASRSGSPRGGSRPAGGYAGGRGGAGGGDIDVDDLPFE
ncbi:MAG: single-stranded DNA-binding protein [Dehalococcoidia bacterium]|nr:single-stranded DNA-binding protein [Dehalococcoidia bacterium]